MIAVSVTAIVRAKTDDPQTMSKHSSKEPVVGVATGMRWR